MANGDPPAAAAADEADEFVIRSGVRAGLKREFNFMMQQQKELARVALGRTRSRTALPSYGGNGGKEGTKSKKPRRSVQKKPPEVPIGEPSISPVTPTLLETEAPNMVRSGADNGCPDPADFAPTEMGDVSAAVVDTDASAAHLDEILVDNGDLGEDFSKSSSCGEESVQSMVNTVGLGEGCCRIDEDAKGGAEILVEARVLSGDCNASDSRIEHKVDSFGNNGAVEAGCSRTAVCGEQKVTSTVVNGGLIENCVEASTKKAGNLIVNENLVNAGVVLCHKKENYAVNTDDSSTVEHHLVSPELALKSLIARSSGKRVTRSAARKESAALSGKQINTSGSKAKKSCDEDEPESTRKLTSAQLLQYDSTGTSSISGTGRGLIVTTKISSTKVPGNVRELLMTGMLEGLEVMYSAPRLKPPLLHGIIRGCAIVCFCSSCKGCNAVSPYNFELHASSNKKHPADYICLSNGMSLRDVLSKCAAVSLDQLETTLRNVIGQVPLNTNSVCGECKKPFHATNIGPPALLCDTCQHSKRLPKLQSPTTSPCSSRSQGAPSSSGVIDHASLKMSSRKTISSAPSTGKLTRKDLRLHKLVFTSNILPEGTEVTYVAAARVRLRGYIKDQGIYCYHCSEVVSPSIFEAHAGRAATRKPYHSIYTSNGVSLHELSVRLSLEHKISTTENDDLCTMCKDGGVLLCCDLCPRAFHPGCVDLPGIPEGSWHCRYCDLNIKEQSAMRSSNAIAAGRVEGVDPVEQIFRRCIRIVTTPENALSGGCAFCKGHDFEVGFGTRTVLLCDQCGREYHVGCLKEHGVADLQELPEGEWYCSVQCNQIQARLKVLISHEPEPLSDLDLDIIKKKHKERDPDKDVNIDIRWKLLCGKDASDDTKLVLSKAITIFHECFDPIIDSSTREDLIPSMVYGRNLRDYDYSGMYCATLMSNSSVVSVGLFRVFGCDIAELPLVATIKDFQGLGYFQSLFASIERLLASLKIKHFVLPTADETEDIWTKKFGFSKITLDELGNYTRGAKLTVFQGTAVLHKLVPDQRFG